MAPVKRVLLVGCQPKVFNSVVVFNAVDVIDLKLARVLANAKKPSKAMCLAPLAVDSNFNVAIPADTACLPACALPSLAFAPKKDSGRRFIGKQFFDSFNPWQFFVVDH
jgi:hypothetical protein